MDEGVGTTATTGRELLRCERLRVGYGGRALLPPIDLSVRSGEFWAVIGRNGTGKTTWFRTVLGLLPSVSGTVRYPGNPPRTSYIPQRASYDRFFPLRARDVVRMGLERGRSVFSPRPLREPRETLRSLEEVGAREIADEPFHSLSEGQKQRVLFARLAASSTELAILDEPTAAMDMVAERETFRILGDLRERRRLAIVVVSHYLRIVEEAADRAVLFDRDAQAVVVGTPREVWAHDVFRARYGTREAVAQDG